MMKDRKIKRDIVAELQNAQLHIVEKALVAFIEDLLGRVPSDEEILAKSFHCHFAATELSVYEKDGKRFAQFWCWDKEHVLALGFIDPQDPLSLYVVRCPREEWPVGLKLYVEQYDPNNPPPHE